MTDKEKTEYFRIGLALLKISTDDKHAELLWRFAEGLYKKKGNFNLMDSSKIEAFVHKKYSEKPKKVTITAKKQNEKRTH